MTNPDPNLVEMATEALHRGCTQCDGYGRVFERCDDGSTRIHECERYSQAVDLVLQVFEATVAAGWRIVQLGTYSGVVPPYVTDEWTPASN